jgi:LacI family transcriptional regulator
MLHVAIAIEMTAGGIGIRHGIAEYSRQFGPWRFTTIHDVRDFEKLQQVNREVRVDGIICQAWDVSAFAAFAGSEIKVVDVSNGKLVGPFPKVLLDNRGAGKLAAEYLLRQGFSRFAVVSGYWHDGFQLRSDAFRERVLQERGTTCEVIDNYRPPIIDAAKEEQHYCEAVSKLKCPVGIYAVSDVQAHKLLVAARSVGLRVPDDAAVLGTDNSPEMCELTDPALSSIEMNMSKAGYEAAKLLNFMMAGNPPPRENLVIKVGQVVARASTDVLAVDDEDVVAAARYIRTHATSGIGVEDVMREVPISRRMLERRFRKAMGRSLHDEIQRVRIEHAKRLLLETDLDVLEVALASGYQSQSYFSRRFAALEGCAPAKYRRANRMA